MKRKYFICVLVLALLLLCTPLLKAETRTLKKTPKHEIELYITSWCPYCKKAKAFFDRQGISYRLYDIEKNPKAAKRKNQLSPNRGVPVAVIDGIVINGWSQRAYQTALEK